jgi:transcriptional regulator with PAS, ATPase and Fis domain
MLILKAIMEGKSYWFPLNNKERAYSLGSAEDCDFCLPFKGISRKHCEFVYKKDNWYARDLNSTNGLFLNGEKITEKEIKDGDILTCGIVSIKILKKPSSEWLSIDSEKILKITGYDYSFKEKKARTTDSIEIKKEYLSDENKCCEVLFSKSNLNKKFEEIMEILEIKNLEISYKEKNEKILIYSRIIDENGELEKIYSFLPEIEISVFPKLEEKKANIASICFTLLSVLKIGYKVPQYEEKKEELPSILGISKISKEIWENALIYKDSDVSVLITGETGVGKEYLAKAIHDVSRRAKKPFIVINFSEFPESLRQSEIFGIEEKVATGVKRNIGKFEQANGGSVLLDEIGDIPQEWQLMLLRILENNYFYRVGGNEPVHLDVRFFFATNKNLEEEVEKGRIRKDFYFRIKGVHFHIPPLRERKEDIAFFLQKYLDILNEKYNKKINFSIAAWNALLCYNWPGNVRELKGELEKIYPLAIQRGIIQKEFLTIEKKEEIPFLSLEEEVEKLEKDLILKAINSTKSISEAIKILKIPRTTFYLKLKKYKIKI